MVVHFAECCQPIPGDTIRVVASPDPAALNAPVALEFRSYAMAVAQDLARHGFRPVESGPAAYLAVLNVQQTSRAGIPTPSPFRIGIGGGSFSGNGGGVGGGVSGGLSVPIGKSTNNDVRINMVEVRIRRQSDGSAVWEGRAIQEIPARQQGSNLSLAVPALSRALLAEFPGETGRVVTVKLPR